MTQPTSQEVKHTPGPWLDESGQWLYEPQKLLESAANAWLMGSAPEMLSALKAAEELIDGWLKYPPPGAELSVFLKNTLAQIKAALLKAGGQ